MLPRAGWTGEPQYKSDGFLASEYRFLFRRARRCQKIVAVLDQEFPEAPRRDTRQALYDIGDAVKVAVTCRGFHGGQMLRGWCWNAGRDEAGLSLRIADLLQRDRDIEDLLHELSDIASREGFGAPDVDAAQRLGGH
jgi:hypothetical protein